MVDVYFLIPTVIAQMFIPIEQVKILLGIPSKETNAKIEIHSVNVKNKSSQYNFEFYKLCCSSY